MGITELKLHAINSKGCELTHMGKHEDAINCYKQAIKINLSYADAIYNMGSSLYYLDRVDEAKELLEDAIKLDQNLPDVCSIMDMLEHRQEFNRNIHNACKHDHSDN